jgi:hypothetical protein
MQPYPSKKSAAGRSAIGEARREVPKVGGHQLFNSLPTL